jgi:hypothetical protein
VEGYYRCPETGGLVFMPPPATDDARLTELEAKMQALLAALPAEIRLKLPPEYFR